MTFHFPEAIRLRRQRDEIDKALMLYENAQEDASRVVNDVCSVKEKLVDLGLPQESLIDWQRRVIEVVGLEEEMTAIEKAVNGEWRKKCEELEKVVEESRDAYLYRKISEELLESQRRAGELEKSLERVELDLDLSRRECTELEGLRSDKLEEKIEQLEAYAEDLTSQLAAASQKIETLEVFETKAKARLENLDLEILQQAESTSAAVIEDLQQQLKQATELAEARKNDCERALATAEDIRQKWYADTREASVQKQEWEIKYQELKSKYDTITVERNSLKACLVFHEKSADEVVIERLAGHIIVEPEGMLAETEDEDLEENAIVEALNGALGTNQFEKTVERMKSEGVIEQVTLLSPNSVTTEAEFETGPKQLALAVKDAVLEVKEKFKQGWNVLRPIVNSRAKVLTEFLLENPKQSDRLADMIAAWLFSNPEEKEEWLPKNVAEKVEKRLSVRKNAALAEQQAIAILDYHKDATWETVRDASSKNPDALEQAFVLAKKLSKGKQTPKTRFVASFVDLLHDYVRETGDESDLEWVPPLLAENVKGLLSLPEAGVSETIVVEELPAKKSHSSFLSDPTPEEKHRRDLLDKLSSTIALDMKKWQAVECATGRNPEQLAIFIEECKSDYQREFVALLPQKLADYMLFDKDHAIIDWIPLDLVQKAEAILELRLQIKEQAQFRVGDIVTSTDPDNVEFGIDCELIDIEDDCWLIVNCNGRRTRLHISEARLSLPTVCNLKIGDYAKLPTGEIVKIDDIRKYGNSHLATVIHQGGAYNGYPTNELTFIDPQEVPEEIKGTFQLPPCPISIGNSVKLPSGEVAKVEEIYTYGLKYHATVRKDDGLSNYAVDLLTLVQEETVAA